MANTGATSGEVQFDQRLFNQSKGMDSGFGDDEAYNVYDKPWRGDSTISSQIYRPSKNIDSEVYGDDLDRIIKNDRFVPDRGFAGTDKGVRRDGPVQFERDEEEDPFGLDKFLHEAKKAQKRTGDYDSGKSGGKKRRE